MPACQRGEIRQAIGGVELVAPVGLRGRIGNGHVLHARKIHAHEPQPLARPVDEMARMRRARRSHSQAQGRTLAGGHLGARVGRGRFGAFRQGLGPLGGGQRRTGQQQPPQHASHQSAAAP